LLANIIMLSTDNVVVKDYAKVTEIQVRKRFAVSARRRTKFFSVKTLNFLKTDIPGPASL
jgi:hypothetical protein